jgi:hypothetical protein
MAQVNEPPASFRQLLNNAISLAHKELGDVCHDCRNNDGREEKLLTFLVKQKKIFLNLLILTQWSYAHEPMLRQVNEAMQSLDKRLYLMTNPKNSLYHIHSSLYGMHQRIYDVPSAVDVLSSGSYPRLPTSIRRPYAELWKQEEARNSSSSSSEQTQTPQCVPLPLWRFISTLLSFLPSFLPSCLGILPSFLPSFLDTLHPHLGIIISLPPPPPSPPSPRLAWRKRKSDFTTSFTPG